jgi:hypothetical protein
MLNRRGAAAYCGISEATFTTHVVPYVPARSIGAKRVWDVKALDKWLDRLSSGAEAEAEDPWAVAMDKL